MSVDSTSKDKLKEKKKNDAELFPHSIAILNDYFLTSLAGVRSYVPP